ncbi:sulfite exporter TauE/SafE family protein [Streptomyces sp. JJ36]|uniref:sulfite exporter TauE/SafE family protein n=1 Tax=Streptomyces sp. JJ36 TaxID=2736645 RepID=UPI001F41B952|nr:sulfite exporter TauE/SafE family protein [Streptomyces sp. JJ36]MCF6525485.1 sulfite exporter TauE/SafE family protein [Streptomyces sp. JJ36]
MPELEFFLVAGLTVLAGSVVQSGLGLGLGLVAAPVLVVLEPALMPGALLTATVVLPLLTVCAEWRHIDWHGLAWGLPARIPGAALGAWLVGVLEPRVLGAAVGTTVLLAVGLSLRVRRRFTVTPAALLTAGTAAGVTGTLTSIAGPPLALLYQHEPAARVRGTLGGFFFAGTLISLAVLGVAGRLTGVQVQVGLLLVPAVLAGYLLGRPLRRRFDSRGVRLALLGVIACSGAALLVRSLA